MINRFCTHQLWDVTPILSAVAQGVQPAETVIKDAKLVNVCTAEIQEGIDVAIAKGRIAYVGANADHCVGERTTVIEADGAYIAPGFLDGHIHVESSMLGVTEYARVTVPHGTVGIYMDPHEICNVLGLEGVKVMDEDAQRVPLKTMITTPSCVPAVPGFEDTGSAVGPADIAETMKWESVVGLGEMMNFPGILSGSDHAHGEVAETLKQDRVVTGHYSLPETDRGLNAYIASGIRCCHESTRAEDALEKMRRGMYAMMREGSAWHDLAALAPVIADGKIDSRFAVLVSDDNHPNTLVEKGHLDYLIRRAMEEGIDAVTAIQMCTINCATCFKMDDELGSIAPGKCADIVFLKDLESIEVLRVMIDGNVVAENGTPLFDPAPFEYPSWVMHSMHVKDPITPESFVVAPRSLDEHATEVTIRVMEVIGAHVGDIERHLNMPVVAGTIQSDAKRDILKTFVFERHHETGTFGYGFTKGFGITRGAMASTVAHDAHNLLVVGANDEDMALAANTLVQSEGGMVVVADGEILGHVTLPIAGLMAPLSAEDMSAKVERLEQAWREIGCTMPSPFMTMALIPLACLPDLRLTNRGLVDCTEFKFVDLLVNA
ncbi:adenine deaminase [Raoultibacter phocaeensis]|uniref:adenine deaminase n=1 Tax=Raoultibacter phocaeensis TaxID=2479841 RepID=UPI0011189178|nr:adenine deaminase [Raoultibacter phocaeensis]